MEALRVEALRVEALRVEALRKVTEEATPMTAVVAPTVAVMMIPAIVASTERSFRMMMASGSVLIQRMTHH